MHLVGEETSSLAPGQSETLSLELQQLKAKQFELLTHFRLGDGVVERCENRVSWDPEISLEQATEREMVRIVMKDEYFAAMNPENLDYFDPVLIAVQLLNSVPNVELIELHSELGDLCDKIFRKDNSDHDTKDAVTSDKAKSIISSLEKDYDRNRSLITAVKHVMGISPDARSPW